ncbi:MAG: ABC transporter permease [Spirochaetales bacterium]|nr:ABC transporter permease [Spirochaetales bacterium]MCF7938209.1 ABC transporter permease [Spirochaetales bacterium]
MPNIRPILRKELRSYFNSPIAYIVILIFLVFTSVWFFYIEQFFARDTASLRVYFNIFPVVFILLIPAMTMRSWAEEKKEGTDEILLTMPFREVDLVLGKYLASLILLGIMLALTIPLPLTLAPLGDFESGQIVGQYLGSVLLGSAGIAVGIFISSLSKNQISAFIFSALILLVITMAGRANLVLNLPGVLSDFLSYISLDYHFESFKKGLLDSRDLVFFLLFTGMFLYFNTRTLVFRKWN